LAAPWTVLDHVTHLAAFDERQRLAAAAPAGFAALVADEVGDGRDVVELVRHELAEMEPEEALAWFEQIRPAMLAALRAVPAGTRIPWYGPSMGVASALTARLMETWAHGVDVADAFGVELVTASRLLHVATLAHRAMPFAFAAHGQAMPRSPIAFHVTLEDGRTVVLGDEAATDVVRGPVLDLCLAAVQRRHVDDLDLTTAGDAAASWLAVAQAFAGPPGAKRAPRGTP
jgi:uncharacterized protein (TIGR03084 family)